MLDVLCFHKAERNKNETSNEVGLKIRPFLIVRLFSGSHIVLERYTKWPSFFLHSKKFKNIFTYKIIGKSVSKFMT